MRRFGLIGKTLKHSFSKSYFEEKFKKENISDSIYSLFELKEVEDLLSLIYGIPNLGGLNVTIPYKESVIPYLDEIDGKAAEIGAVNTVVIKNKKLIGYNTDYIGFKESLQNFIENNVQNALILGTGGASKAVQVVLKDIGVNFQLVSRTKGLTYENLNEKIFSQNQLIINTTPLGTFPNVDECPNMPYEFLNESYYLYDLVYNPKEPLFLNKGVERKARIKNGEEMLVLQAEESWKIWNK